MGNKRDKITKEEIAELYKVAKAIYEKTTERKEGIQQLKNLGINPSSANDYIYNFKHFVKGEEYKRTTNNKALIYFLNNIRKDYGKDTLEKALTALDLHIQYYEGIRNTIRRKDRAVLADFGGRGAQSETTYPDEVNESEKHYEGAVMSVKVNRYERDPNARAKCLKKYGYKCEVCQFDFEHTFGVIGKKFIHVHHLKELSRIKKEYEVDPIEDLRPVCPNCHAMLHKRKQAYSIKELQAIIKENKPV